MSTSTLIAAAADVLPMIEVPDIEPDMGAPGVGAAMQVGGMVAGWTAVALVIGIFVAVLLLVFGGLSPNGRTKAYIALGLCAGGAVLLGSGSAVMNYFSGISLV